MRLKVSKAWWGMAASLLLAAIALLFAFPRTDGFRSSDWFQARLAAVEREARQGPPFRAIIFGDSIVQLAPIAAICGAGTLNAGVAGARIADVRSLLPRILAVQPRPERIVIAVGVNDSDSAGPTPPEQFAADLEAIMRRARQASDHVRLASIAPIATTGQGAPSHSADAIAAYRRIIARYGAPLPVHEALAAQDGALAAGDSTDGLHLSAAGYRKWGSAIAPACR